MDSSIGYREEGPIHLASIVTDDEDNLNPSGRLTSDGVTLKTRDKDLKIATWNVRTLYQPGKLDNAIQEMENMQLDIMGMAETRWTGSGKISREKYTMTYSGGEEQHENGVGIIINNNIARAMMGYIAISDRVIMMKLRGKPFNINILQVYSPTQDHDDEEIEKFYEEIQNGLQHTRSDDILYIMGDLYAKVGS